MSKVISSRLWASAASLRWNAAGSRSRARSKGCLVHHPPGVDEPLVELHQAPAGVDDHDRVARRIEGGPEQRDAAAELVLEALASGDVGGDPADGVGVPRRVVQGELERQEGLRARVHLHRLLELDGPILAERRLVVAPKALRQLARDRQVLVRLPFHLFARVVEELLEPLVHQQVSPLQVLHEDRQRRCCRRSAGASPGSPRGTPRRAGAPRSRVRAWRTDRRSRARCRPARPPPRARSGARA